MTGSVVLLGTKYRSNLEDAVKYTNHHLFVELRALSKLCFLVEVVQFEDVCSTLCSAGNDLRGVHLGESLRGEELAETTDNSFLNFEFCTLSDVSQRNRTKTQLRLKGSVHLPLVDCDRHSLCRLGEHADCLQTNLKTVRSTLLKSNYAGDLNR